ncbi:MAG: hypothetical protein AVDCRST_MAG49-3342, partial [uncultured Thermomicrobiales bacterium]
GAFGNPPGPAPDCPRRRGRPRRIGDPLRPARAGGLLPALSAGGGPPDRGGPAPGNVRARLGARDDLPADARTRPPLAARHRPQPRPQRAPPPPAPAPGAAGPRAGDRRGRAREPAGRHPRPGRGGVAAAAPGATRRGPRRAAGRPAGGDRPLRHRLHAARDRHDAARAPGVGQVADAARSAPDAGGPWSPGDGTGM